MAMSQLNEHPLFTAIKCRHPLIYIATGEEEEAAGIVVSSGIKLKREVKSWSVITGIVSGVFSEEHEQEADSNKPEIALHQLRDAAAESIIILYDIIDHLESPVTMRGLRELLFNCRRFRSTLILIDHRSDIPESISRDAVRIDIPLPTPQELNAVANETLRQLNESKETIVKISKDDYRLIIKNLRGLSKRQARQVISAAALRDGRFSKADIDDIQEAKRALLHRESNLEVLNAETEMTALAGFARLKQWLSKRHPATLQAELPTPRGILLLGVPGAGKSYCARAIATDWQVPLLRLDAGSLYNSFVGESERRLREALAQAEAMAPAVLWIDEIEKAFASAASKSSDGGLSQRMFGFLLTWMQEHPTPVFVVATANDIQALPPELMRKGRFDQIFFVDLPTPSTREEIIRIHAARFGILDSIDVAELAAHADGFTGAELEHAIISAKTEHGDALSSADLKRILDDSPPLAKTMSERIRALQAWAKERCLSVE